MKTTLMAMTLGEIVTLHPSLAADLERRGLDYCCHGARTLAAAATDAGLDPQTVAAELATVGTSEPPAAWASLATSELVDHVESVHHRYLWAELPRIAALVDKIVAVHGDRHPELFQLQRLYVELRADLEPHLTREEQSLFPLVRQLDAARSRSEIEPLVEQIELLSGEHETVGELLEQLRRVTDGYATPADACASYTACYRALADLEADTHLHVHKENNLLFPHIQARFAGAAHDTSL
ncbi:MAG: iron-sulfur cluster repair di-iron protein [Ilumatobacteraceae bacterium]